MSKTQRATLKAEVRSGKGTGAARAIRREGKIPATVYAKGKDQVFLAINTNELYVEYNRGRFFSRVLEIDTGKTKILVNPKEIQFDRVKDIPIHADFLAVDAHSQIRISLPVEIINQDKCPGIKRGGILNVVRRKVDVFCNIDNIPEKVTADLEGLRIGENIKWSRLIKPEGILPVIKDRDFTIISIAGRAADDAVAAVVDPNAPTAPVVTGQKNANVTPDAAGAKPAAGGAAKPAAKK